MPRKLETCVAGHKMTTDNIYHRKKHGHTYPECRECIRLARKNHHSNGYTVADQRRIAKLEVTVEDTSQITACPKCAGILKWGKDSRHEDAVSCIYCGWRPSAKLVTEL
jgi:predicted RNA-binding Zn-ribbon protein involved in translation (DUF1610 family)